MTDEELREKVIRHDFEFQSLTTSLKELSESMKKLTNGLEQVVVINERLVSMDKDLKDSFKRVHSRADKTDEKIDTFMKDMEVVRILVKYPKLLLFLVVGFVAMSIDPIRKLLLGA